MLEGLEKAWNSYFRLDETTPPEYDMESEDDESICPECMQFTPEQELEVFGGICEHCNGLPKP